ncbi:MAG: LuxR C-terminal-related transcriptional regulator [Bacteroidota bacterium]
MPRPRLLARLDEGMRERLTLVSASAGAGKTTLVSTWLAERERSAAWLSLDEGDSDPVRFLTHLVAALQTAVPDLGKVALGELQSAQPPSSDQVLTEVLNELAATDRPLILVLDDYHAVDDPRVDDALAFLIERLPPHAHVLVTTRQDPALPLPRLRARGHLTEIRAADLRFTKAEAKDFLNGAMGLGLSDADVAALEARTEGWAAGLQLAALSMRGRADTSGFVASFTGSHRFVTDYLVEEVLDLQPGPVRSFLLQTSVLDRLSGPLCDVVLDVPSGSGQTTLEALLRAGLFVVPLDDERRWYRYHHLFGDLLRQRLGRLAPGDVSALHNRASAWFEAEGSAADAIRHALAAGSTERAADLVEGVAPAVRRERQEAAMLRWLEALPDDIVRSRPNLSADYAWALYSSGRGEEADGRLADVERWLGAVTDSDTRRAAEAAGMVVANEDEFRALPMRHAIYHAVRAQARGDMAGTAEHAQRALDLSAEGDILARGAAAALLGLASWVRGDLETAHRTFAEGMEHLRRDGSLADAVAGTAVLAEIRIVQGRLSDAVETYERSLRFAEQHSEALPGTASLHVGLGEIRLERGDLDAAERDLRTAEALGEGAALPEHRYRTHVVEARLAEARGDLSRALERLDEAERLHLTFPLPDTCPIAARKARVWVRQGRVDKATGWARERGISASDDLSYLREYEHVTLARVLLAKHQRDGSGEALRQAADLLKRLLSQAESGARTGRVIEILVLTALASQAQGDDDRALEALDRALSIAEAEGYVEVFVAEGERVRRLLRRAATAEGGPRGYAARLLSVLEERVPSGPEVMPGMADLVQPLTPREVEVVRLIATGMTNGEIADHLFVSPATVKRHVANAYGKLEVRNRTEAASRARDLGLL